MELRDESRNHSPKGIHCGDSPLCSFNCQNPRAPLVREGFQGASWWHSPRLLRPRNAKTRVSLRGPGFRCVRLGTRSLAGFPLGIADVGRVNGRIATWPSTHADAHTAGLLTLRHPGFSFGEQRGHVLLSPPGHLPGSSAPYQGEEIPSTTFFNGIKKTLEVPEITAAYGQRHSVPARGCSPAYWPPH